jgi:hypothetical protein
VQRMSVGTRSPLRREVRASLRLVGLVVLGACTGCATSTLDLERARRHYEAHDHLAALALLRLLGDELDELEPHERTQWAYLLGMTDRRIADGLPRSAVRERERFYACSRDRLEIALARRADAGNSLSPELRAIAQKALSSLPALPHPRGVCREAT